MEQAEQVEEVKAGRELDAWIAREVMGLPVESRLLDGNDYMTYAEPDNPAAGWWLVEPYSTEPASALGVAEKLKADDFWPSMTWKSGVLEDDWNRAVWFVRFRCVRGGTRGDHWAADESLALAICLAARKVFERER